MKTLKTLDRATARALVDAGYMPLRDYIDRFGVELTEPTAAAAARGLDLGDHRTRPWGNSTRRGWAVKRNSRKFPKNSAA